LHSHQPTQIQSIHSAINIDESNFASWEGFVANCPLESLAPVPDEHATRLTPQAFSHFSFYHSGGEQLVCDIQGVGDLYTDPQIHTTGSGMSSSGDNGTNGIIAFFQVSVCVHV
jgi:hypothetical protein